MVRGRRRFAGCDRRRQAAIGRVRTAETLGRPSLDDEGYSQFDIEETPIETADGSYEVSLSVAFATPSSPSKNAPAIPLMSLAPQVSQGSGTLKGGRSYYYAISAIGADGNESAFSFIARASAPAGDDTNSVPLHDLSFAPATASFNVYRGPNPTQLLRIAKEQAVSAQWTDNGAERRTRRAAGRELSSCELLLAPRIAA